MSLLILADNLDVLRAMANESVDFVYIDPPFNTGKRQQRFQLRTVQDTAGGDRTGYKGQRYRTIKLGSRSYDDIFDDYLGFLEPRLQEIHRVIRPHGSLFFHIDYRESHYCKVQLDAIFGRASFMNEIIWAYDYGARSRKRWSAKHDTLFWYAKNPHDYTFNYDQMERIPYMAPGLVGAEKAKRGKTPTDVWWHTIVSPTGKEKVGYPTQKPLGLLSRILKVHTNPGDVVADFFAGSGSLGAAAATLDRDYVLVDNHSEAFAVMQRRLPEATALQHPAPDTLNRHNSRVFSQPHG